MGPFATATELAERVGHTAPPNDLARWQAALQDVSNLIRSYTGQSLSVVTGESVAMQKTNDHRLFLPEKPITAITSVTVSGVLQAASTYDFTSWALFHVDGSNWPNGATVVYSHGFAETTAEFGDLRGLTLDIVQRALFGPQSETFGPERVEAAGWNAELHLTMDDWMRLQGFGAMPVG